MKTVLKIGPADHGKPIPYDDFAAAAWEEGYQYELIDGKLYVSPQPNFPQGRAEKWLYDRLNDYSRQHPEVVNFVCYNARVFVPDRPAVTNPEPDLAAYRDFPLDLPWEELSWDELSPVLVAEGLSLDDPDKDLVRNVELYLQVSSIKEYWVLDTRESADRPELHVYRRRGKAWQRVIVVPYGGTYTTKLLPGFELIIDPRR